MPAHRVNKVGRVCPTPGCCRPSMPDRPHCYRCKKARNRYDSSERGLEQRRLRRKTTRA